MIASLSGMRILVLDDEPMIGVDIAIALEDSGAVVVGPVHSAADALCLIGSTTEGGRVDGAILDVNLGDHTCEAVAAQLFEGVVPFIFHTGNYGEMAVILDGFSAPVVHKPAQTDTILGALASELASGR